VRDNVIESALAMFSMLVRDGKEASFFRFSEGLWLKTDIHTMADVYLLQELLSSFSPSVPAKLVPPEITDSGKSPICFTAAFSENSSSVAEICAACPDSMIIAAESAGLNNICTNLWTVTSDYEFRKQGER
jgi:hypothetical protein